jgi:hypothetical protein
MPPAMKTMMRSRISVDTPGLGDLCQLGLALRKDTI